MLDLSIVRLTSILSAKYSELRTIDVSGITELLEFPDNFMWISKKLVSVDLNALKHLRRIGNHFLMSCRELKYLHWSELDNIQHIGVYFMSDCPSLEHLDLRPLRNLRIIPDDFMNASHVHGILDFSPLTKVERIGDGFCSGIYCNTIDLSGLATLGSVGKYFLGSQRVDSIIFPEETRLISLPIGFMMATRVGSLDFRRSLEHVKTVERQFCANITTPELNLSTMISLESIGEMFLDVQSVGLLMLPKCKIAKLEMASLSGTIGNIHGLDEFLEHVITIDNRTMALETSMDQLVLRMPNLVRIGNYFCSGMRGVSHIVIDAPKLSHIGNGFCSYISVLQSINLMKCPSLTVIGDSFCRDNNSVRKIKFSPHSNVRSVGRDFCTGCTKMSLIGKILALIKC